MAPVIALHLVRVILVTIVYFFMRNLREYEDTTRRQRALLFGGILAVVLLPYELLAAIIFRL